MTGNVFVVQGDALRLPLADRSVHAIVCDPPYSLSFMGRQWDSFGGPQAFQAWCQQWATEALRVLRPGGWLLACGGTRTWHRLACGLEDAGFELRDTIAKFGPGGDATEASFGPLAWIYGSGFPSSKSLDVGKAIDKANGRPQTQPALAAHIRERRQAAGVSMQEMHTWFPQYREVVKNWERTDKHGARVPTLADWTVLRERLAVSDEFLPLIERVEAEREVVGRTVGAGNGSVVGLGSPRSMASEYDLTAPATPEAERWQGWGTALKPSWEPVIVARKPLSGTVAQNVLTYGTGALNIAATKLDGKRWPPNAALVHSPGCQPTGTRKIRGNKGIQSPHAFGLINDDGWKPSQYGQEVGYTDADGMEEITAWACQSDCPVALLDQQSGELPGASSHGRPPTTVGFTRGTRGQPLVPSYADQGGASRFMYTAKAGPNERVTIDGEGHPTVKPLALMRWLVRLVTPPGGLILDMFAGSGTTGEAAMLEGFRCVLIDKDPANLPSIRVRTHPYVRRTKIITNGSQMDPEQGRLL